jgi:S1-C subfamily serine protease
VAWRSLEVELEPLTLAEARARGLGVEQARRLEKHDPRGRQVLAVRSVTAGSPSEALLAPGDLLISIDDEPVTRFHDVERASMRENVDLRVLRDGEEIDFVVPTTGLDGEGTDRALIWAGTLLQRPPRALARQQQLPREGVYVARYWFGSPANRYGLPAATRILEVDGTPTPDLDTFLAVVGDKPDRGSVRLELADLDGRVSVITLELDLEYWPTWELVREPEGWVRRRL